VKLLIVGCGRVGSAIAERTAADGHDVSVVDEDAEALQRLSEDWPGQFIHGHGLDTDVLVRGGIEDADAVVVCTDGDNTNIVIAQVAQKRFRAPCVVCRVLDPARAAFYSTQGLQTVSPTSSAIEFVYQAICGAPPRQQQPTAS
jgi:trk system potassium uptake protein TrkA